MDTIELWEQEIANSYKDRTFETLFKNMAILSESIDFDFKIVDGFYLNESIKDNIKTSISTIVEKCKELIKKIRSGFKFIKEKIKEKLSGIRSGTLKKQVENNIDLAIKLNKEEDLSFEKSRELEDRCNKFNKDIEKNVKEFNNKFGIKQHKIYIIKDKSSLSIDILKEKTLNNLKDAINTKKISDNIKYDEMVRKENEIYYKKNPSKDEDISSILYWCANGYLAGNEFDKLGVSFTSVKKFGDNIKEVYEDIEKSVQIVLEITDDSEKVLNEYDKLCDSINKSFSDGEDNKRMIDILHMTYNEIRMQKAHLSTLHRYFLGELDLIVSISAKFAKVFKLQNTIES